MSKNKKIQNEKKDFKVESKQGLHARPAALFVQTANQFEAEVTVYKDDLQVNGKSIMGIMTLAAEMGTIISVEISGKDAENAMDAISKLFLNNFGESE